MLFHYCCINVIVVWQTVSYWYQRYHLYMAPHLLAAKLGNQKRTKKNCCNEKQISQHIHHKQPKSQQLFRQIADDPPRLLDRLEWLCFSAQSLTNLSMFVRLLQIYLNAFLPHYPIHIIWPFIVSTCIRSTVAAAAILDRLALSNANDLIYIRCCRQTDGQADSSLR